MKSGRSLTRDTTLGQCSPGFAAACARLFPEISSQHWTGAAPRVTLPPTCKRLQTGLNVRASIEDVARRAGVSTATVSRALRGLPHVSAATREQVLRVATDLGYAPSKSAASLATGRTHTVGVVTPHVAKWFFAHLLEAIEAELRVHSYDVLLFAVPTRVDLEPAMFDPTALRERVDAVIVLTLPLTGRELDGLRALQLPLAFVGAAVPAAMSVRVDDVAIGRVATEHLISLGHRRIGHIGGDPGEPLNFSAPVDRRAGWMSALRDAGLEPERALDVPGYFTVEGGRCAMEQLLALPEPPTAVFAASDEMAFGALAAARASGCTVPSDVSVIGVDGHELAETLGLTTVVQPVFGQGRLAADLVLQALGGDDSRRHEHVLLGTQLLVRESTARPRRPRRRP